MAFLMTATALQYTNEGLELSKKADGCFDGDEYLEARDIYFNPATIVDICQHPGKPNQCFLMLAGDDHTVLESALDLRDRIEDFMSNKSIFN